MPHKSDERLARGTLPRRHLACLTKAPFGASLTPCPRHNIPANLVVQLESSRLPAPTKSWLDRDVSLSELNHGTAFGGVRGSQGGLGEQSQAPLVPLAAAAAAALRTVLRSVRSAALRRHLACLTKAPFLRFTHASPEAVVGYQSRGSVGRVSSPFDHQMLA